jgi:hypothetical protein
MEMLTPERWLSRGWRAFALNMGAFAGATLILIISTPLTGGLLVVPLGMGLLEMALRARRGEAVAAWEITRGFRFFLPGIVLWGVGVAAGLTLCVGRHLPVVGLLTGIFGGPLLNLFGVLAALCIVDRNVGVREALGRVLLIVERHWLGLWAVSLLFMILGDLGGLFFGVGALATVPWIACSWAAAYQDLFERP